MKINQRGAEEEREREREKKSESYNILDGSMEDFLLTMTEENLNHAAERRTIAGAEKSKRFPECS